MPSNQILMYKKNDLQITFTVHDEENSSDPYNLSQIGSVTMYIKRRTTDDNAAAFITKTGTVIDAANGKVQFLIVPSDTALDFITDNVSFPVEIEVITGDGKVYTALKTTAQFK